jgi:glutamate/tyrosine decarboxylase-like PLP-dependent enzyme
MTEPYRELLIRALDWVDAYRSRWPRLPGEGDDDGRGRDRVPEALEALLARLDETYPFHAGRYAGQMLKPPHPAALLGAFAAQWLNPNNHALDGGPATSALEQEAVATLAALYGVDPFLGHLTGGGTVANLEALFVAREEHPHRGIAVAANAHYTHARVAHLLRMPIVAVAVDDRGRMDVADLARVLDTGEVGTVVATLGTTALGAIDPVDEILPLARAAGVRIHVDAAYGGYFRLIADGAPEPSESTRGSVPAAPFVAAGDADSLVIDPHKHGLQPYGCGAVLFADPSVGRHYRHDSPYTYFTSDDLHLGEISLECSRPGAAAAALWLTLQVFPLRSGGEMADLLGACRQAAVDLARRARTSELVAPAHDPELDIVTLIPRTVPFAASEVSRVSEVVFRSAMGDRADPVYLSTLRLSTEVVARLHPRLARDTDEVVVLRLCLLKPGHAAVVPALLERIEDHVRRALTPGPR